MELKKTLRHLTKVEKIILAFLMLVFFVSAYQLAAAFYQENSEPDYSSGGIYVEGAVGQVASLNPLFVQQGSVAQDLSGLIFSGLTKYDTETGAVVGDLANIKVSDDKKKYTFVIKDAALWHDGKRLSADDVIFTYNDVIKNPEFKGSIQTYNDYSGMRVNKIDERTVEFLLEKPDSFFLVKTMTGILPKHLLEKESVALLETAPFNFNPVGSGPYKFVSQVELSGHTEFGLEAFKDFYEGRPNIDSLVMKVFSTYEELKKDMGNLNGIRGIPVEETEAILKKNRFTLDRYELPQYVAVFINNEAPKLKDAKIRLALQLGTDKKSLIKALGQNKIIDTPLLEIDQENWTNQYSVVKANGALFETEWQIPNKDKVVEKKTEETPKEEDTTEAVTFINSPNGGKNWQTNQEPITITGTAPSGSKSIMVNDYELLKFTPGDAGWTYTAATKFDSLKPGENIYDVYATDATGKKTLIDSIKIQFGPSKTTAETLEAVKVQNEEAGLLPTRQNKNGDSLSFRLITSEKPESYSKIADELKGQWQKIGVKVDIEVLDSDTFQSRVAKRDYDLLIFGQSLGYNLDAYPYWHSSQAKEGGLNLSQFKNFVADSFLEKARLEEEEARKKTLNDLQGIISKEVPAVFLYSPTYFSAVSKNVYHPPFKHLATTSDRLDTIKDWYSNVDRKFKEGFSILSFFPWLIKQF